MSKKPPPSLGKRTSKVHHETVISMKDLRAFVGATEGAKVTTELPSSPGASSALLETHQIVVRWVS